MDSDLTNGTLSPHYSDVSGLTPSNVTEYFVRCSTPDDIHDIYHFYNDHQHKDVDPIALDRIVHWAETGRFFLIKNRHNEIIASSAAKDYYSYSADHKSVRRWTEIGATRVVSDHVKGLYPFIISAQVLHEAITRKTPELFFASIYKDSPVIKMLNEKVGWDLVKNPSKDLFVHDGDEDLHAKGDVVWLASPPKCLFKQAQNVVQTIIQGGFKTKQGDGHARADFSEFPICNKHFAGLQRMGDIHARGGLNGSTPSTYDALVAKYIGHDKK